MNTIQPANEIQVDQAIDAQTHTHEDRKFLYDFTLSLLPLMD
jgi:hypothetical protein